MIVLAWFYPGLSKSLPLHEISSIGISGIFFFYGLKLSPARMLEGLTNWELHFVVQSATFLLFPVLVLLIKPFIHGDEYTLLWLAVFFLAALPSTVSSSVVMVSIAGGNIPGAIFNASISGLIGILITPLWMGFFLTKTMSSFDFGEVFGALLLKILVPVITGMLLHRFFGKFAMRHKKQLTTFDKTVILLIVYQSFSESFLSGVFDDISIIALLIVGAGVIMLFFAVWFIISLISKWLAFDREDRITALFSGSKKSLVHGTVFSSVLFAGMSSAGIFLVPIMIYHAFQLVIISIIAQRWSRIKTDALWS